MDCVKELDTNRDDNNNLSFAQLRNGITVVECAHNIHAGFTLKPDRVESIVQTFGAKRHGRRRRRAATVCRRHPSVHHAYVALLADRRAVALRAWPAAKRC